MKTYLFLLCAFNITLGVTNLVFAFLMMSLVNLAIGISCLVTAWLVDRSMRENYDE